MSDRTTEIREAVAWEGEIELSLRGMHFENQENENEAVAALKRLAEAARAYADLLDNGPDYEAALGVRCVTCGGVGYVREYDHPLSESPSEIVTSRCPDPECTAVVDTPKDEQPVGLVGPWGDYERPLDEPDD